MDADQKQSNRNSALEILSGWGIKDEQKDQLLSDYDSILCVLSIADSLHAIYENDSLRANRWPLRPNQDFGGQTPLAAMLAGEAEKVARYLKFHLYNGW